MTTQYTALPDTVCIEVRGTNAGAFLHAQLSQAVAELAPSHAPLAAWLDARGRVRAIVRVHRRPERWLLVAPRDGAEALVKKLRMFVLRAAVTLEVATDLAVGAVLGATPEWLAAHELPADTEPNDTIARSELSFTRIGATFWQVLGPPAALAALASTLPSARASDVAAAEIALGLPLVTAATGERFVAQMLNLDALGALSFDKGCYPGQEIVARVHHLGGVKRRVRRYAATAPTIATGTPVLAGELAVGEVLAVAAAEPGCELLALVDNSAVNEALTSAGAALVERPLPFAVSHD